MQNDSKKIHINQKTTKLMCSFLMEKEIFFPSSAQLQKFVRVVYLHIKKDCGCSVGCSRINN
jgi:hypothetical protein